MATQNSNAGKQGKSSDAKREAPAKTPEESTRAEASAVEASAVEASGESQASEPAPRPVPVVVERAAPAAVIAPVGESADAQDFSASVEFDAGLWSRKAVELWAENAAAFLDLAEQIARAKTFDEIVDLQSQFASERFAALLRQSQELMAFAQDMASLSAAPLCGARKAA